MKTCIVSIFMPNIDPAIVEAQSKVVEKYNKSKIPHLRVQFPMPSVDNQGAEIDTFMQANKERDELKFDNIILLDIDCIPLNDKILDYVAQRASEGVIIGNATRSNHIENNQHVFAGGYFVAFSKQMYEDLGSPSFTATPRGDCAEELTWRARELSVPIELFMPTRFDAPPTRMSWEKNQEPYWRLADGMPVYGIGTTYGHDVLGECTYHNWQIRMPGNKDRFIKKCEEILNG